MAKHARHAAPRSGSGSLVLGVLALLAAVALAGFVLVTDPTWAPRAGIVVALVIGLAVVVMLWRLTRQVRRMRADANSEAAKHRREISALRLEISQAAQVTSAVLDELAALRAELVAYVLPIASEPDPVYPSLHLPLVRDAFSDTTVDATILRYTPPTPPAEVPPTIETDGASEGVPSHTYVDLTAQHRARHAAGA